MWSTRRGGGSTAERFLAWCVVAWSLCPGGARAAADDRTVDTSRIKIRRAVAQKLTPEELQSRKEAFARRIEARRAALRPAPVGDTPAEICPLATAEVSTLPYGPVSDTTVGAANDYTAALSSTTVCSAPTNCVGRPSGRGEVYAGTGWGPDKAYRIRTDANCTLTIDLVPTDPSPADDLGLLVYQAQCSNELADCVCASDTGFPGNPDPDGNTEGVVLEAVARTDYFIVIDGYSSLQAPPGNSGPFTLGITGSGCSLVAGLPSQYHTVAPCRLVDTRNSPGPLGGPELAPGANRTFTVAGSCGVPANAVAVFLNATIVSPSVGGNLRIFPTGSLPPTVSALNYSSGQTRGNNGIYSLDDQGRLDVRLFQASGTAHLVVDVAGYFLE
jgi:hypothetical protein